MAKPTKAPEPNPIDRFIDTWRHAAINSPWGAGGLVNALFRAKGYSQQDINRAKAATNKDYDTKYKNAPVFKTRPGHPLDYVSPDNIGRGAVTLLGHLLGGVDPTYAVGGSGPNVAARALDMAGKQGAFSLGRQQTDINKGQQKKLDPKQTAAEMALGGAIQVGHELAGAARNLIKPKETLTGNEVVPFKQPMGKDGLPPRGEFASPKDAAMHMRSTGKTQATHDIVAHGDNSYSVQEKVPTVIKSDDIHEVRPADAPQADVPEPLHEVDEILPTEHLAPDGFPNGNAGGVRPIDPREIAKIMGDPEAAGLTGINDNMPNRRMNNRDRSPYTDEELANLPPANREYLEHLTPAERQEMDASVPTRPLDNTGYEKFTPNSQPPAPANDTHQAEITPFDAEEAAMNEKGFVKSVVDGRWLPRDEAYEEAHQQWVDKNFPEGTEVRGFGHNIDENGNYKPDEVVHAIEDQDSEIAKARQNKDEDLDPQYDETFQSKPGVNARRMAKMLGPQLYGDPSSMGAVSIKEVLQNSFDAVKDAMTHHGMKKGKIDIVTSAGNRAIEMRDNGIGMSPDTLGGKFLQIAGSGKEGDNASGGFGIAKMLFLYGNKDLNVLTMRDGKVSELKATGEQLFDSLEDPSSAPHITVREPTEADHRVFPEGHGTYIRMTLPENFKDPMTGEMKEINFPRYEWEVPALTNSPLFHNVDVTFNDHQLDDVGSKFPMDKYAPFANVKFQWGDADIYVSKEHEPDKKHGDNINVLSNGLYQFSETMPKDPKNPWGEAVPYTFYVDLHPTVKPDEPGYPFSFNRQSLTEQAKDELGHVKDYIQKLYGQKSLKDEAKSFGEIYYIDPQTGEHSELHDLTPDVPVHEDGFRGIQAGDQVEIKDGRMIVNGEDLPILTPEQLKKQKFTADTLMIDPGLVDPDKIMVHDNTMVDLGDGSPPEKMIDHMRQQFGEDFDNLIHTAGQSFMELRNMVAGLTGEGDDYYGLTREAIGVSLDPKYRGVSIRVPFSGSFINPLVPRGETDLEKGYNIVGTMIHELAHHKIRNHNADFPAEMQKIWAQLLAHPDYGFAVWQQHIAETLAKYGDIIDYGQNLYEKGHAKPYTDSFKDGVRDDSKGSDAGSDEQSTGRSEGGQSPEGMRDDAQSEYPTIEVGDASGDLGSRAGKKALLDKLRNVIEAGKPLRAETSRQISKERGERIRAAYAARAKQGGEAGLYKELAALKGDMSKARIQSIRSHFTQEEIDAIFDIVKNNPKLAGYDSINAQKALSKLFGKEHGELPTEAEAKLLAMALPKNVIRALLSDEEGSATTDWLNKYADPIAEVAGIPRALKTMGDFGVALRQAVPLIGTKEYWKTLPEIFKGMASEKLYQNSWKEIESDPDFYWMQVGKVAFSRLDDPDISLKEEAIPGHLAQKIPFVRGSERGFTGYLNVLRFHTFKRLLNDARNLGLDPTGDPAALKQMGDFVNVMTGRGSLGKTGDKAAPFLSSMFFSPRLAASRATMLNPVWYARLSPQLRKEAARAIAAYSLYMGVVLGIAANAFGAHVEMDPRSTDFARARVKDTRFDFTGGLQPFVRTFWQFVTNSKKNASGKVQPLGQKYGQPTRLDLVTNFVEGKASPNAAFLMDLARGKDIMHPKNIAGEVNTFNQFGKDNWFKNPAVNLGIPMPVGSTLEAGARYGYKDPLTYAVAIAEEAGIGTNTYTARKPKSNKKGEFGGSGFKNEFKSSGFGKGF
jgi:hypothetical protein